MSCALRSGSSLDARTGRVSPAAIEFAARLWRGNGCSKEIVAMIRRIELRVNGEPSAIETDGERPLLEVLREDLGLTGTKYGCGEGRCRACTVLVDGSAVTSCRYPVSRADGKDVRTIEGLAADGALHPVQEAFLELSAMQCGYCVPGMVLTTVALLERDAAPDRAAIVKALDGNLCRCCGYGRILEAVELAARHGREAHAGAPAGAGEDER
jgi:aerobic-type carbon monoxide dehydrogenase small subunit (CoxS/CutS family)